MVLDERVPPDLPARLLCAAVNGLDVGRFHAAIKSVEGAPGRPAFDPRVLICLWLRAYSEDVGGGRELERLCQFHDAYRWIAGGIDVSDHTLNDFRVRFKDELDDPLTQGLGKRVHGEVITVSPRFRQPPRERLAAHRRDSTLRRRAIAPPQSPMSSQTLHADASG